MLKKRLKKIAKKSDNKKEIEIIKDGNLSSVKGGMAEAQVCSLLYDCSFNFSDCPHLHSCGANFA
ncbi:MULTISPECIES: hypothetical protein [Epilithonimonas]|uniref:Uncharacterized protein n=1 Tax=Epilithonimonas hominis TaxID=420404 RepID=A0A3N0XDD8_9FLAO|nr:MULTISPECIES: hypothetical protein [Epilithonimonas]ROI14369.1 hypothetical protein EGH73_03545 [Epilithonimonas hominis]HAP96289.1 hypothetical protein [Chryseobacterium sp.]